MNTLFALLTSPAPLYMANFVLPPMPNIRPIEKTILNEGIARFNEASPVFPRLKEMKNVSARI